MLILQITGALGLIVCADGLSSVTGGRGVLRRDSSTFFNTRQNRCDHSRTTVVCRVVALARTH